MKGLIKNILKTQAGRFLLGVTVIALLAVMMTGVDAMNFLKVDMTAQKVMSMSEESTEVARSIEEDVTIRYFAGDSGIHINLIL